ncbi:MAG: putative sugar nucleotidyl transferase, partial [Gemmatimonadales bacterium]
MTALYLLEPDPAGPAWAPFAGVRPVSELRAGVWRIRERWEAAFGTDTTAILGSHVDGFQEPGTPPVRPVGPIGGPAVIGVSRFAPSGSRLTPARQHRRLVHEGITVG